MKNSNQFFIIACISAAITIFTTALNGAVTPNNTRCHNVWSPFGYVHDVESLW